MGMRFFSTICSSNLIFVHFPHLGFLRKRGLSRLLHTASSATSLVLEEDPLTDCVPVCKVSLNSAQQRNFERNLLFPVVVRVFHTLNWEIATKIRFSKAVENYGVQHSVDVFRIIVYIFASVRMEREVYSLLWDIVSYYREANLDMFELFESLLESSNNVGRSVFVLETLTKVFAANSMLEKALYVFVRAKKIGVQLGIKSCNFLLKCLTEANEEGYAESLFEEIKVSRVRPNVFTYTIMMKFYCGGEFGKGVVDIRRANDIFEEIIGRGLTPTVFTYGIFINGLCRAGHVEHLVLNMRYKGQNLNVYCYNAIIYGFCLKDRLHEARSIFDDMKNNGISPDVYSYGILIEGFCRNNDLKFGCFLLEEMERNGLKPSLVSYTSLINGFCKNGLMDDSLHLFSSLKASEYKYDNVVYDVMIHGFCTQGDMDYAYKLFEDMVADNLIPDLVNVNNLINGYCDQGSQHWAVGVWTIMVEGGIIPSTRTSNVIVNSYCKEKLVEEALDFMSIMDKNGIAIDLFTYNAVIDRLCKEGYPEKAREIWAVMFKRYSFPNVVNYSSIIDGYAKLFNHERALFLFSRMLRTGIMADVKVYTVLVNMYCNQGKMGKAYLLFWEMIGNGLNPDVICYTSIIDGFCRSGDIWKGGKARSLCNYMLRGGQFPSVVTYTSLIDGFCKRNRIDIANMLLDDMRKNEITPTVETYTVLIATYRRLGKVDRAYAVFEEMKREGVAPDDLVRSILGFDSSFGYANGKCCKGERPKSIACMKLEEYHTAKNAFLVGASLAPQDQRFTNFIKECEERIASITCSEIHNNLLEENVGLPKTTPENSSKSSDDITSLPAIAPVANGPSSSADVVPLPRPKFRGFLS